MAKFVVGGKEVFKHEEARWIRAWKLQLRRVIIR